MEAVAVFGLVGLGYLITKFSGTKDTKENKRRISKEKYLKLFYCITHANNAKNIISIVYFCGLIFNLRK